jgi:hypothetical protein
MGKIEFIFQHLIIATTTDGRLFANCIVLVVQGFLRPSYIYIFSFNTYKHVSICVSLSDHVTHTNSTGMKCMERIHKYRVHSIIIPV